MYAFIWLIDTLISLYIWLLIASAILSWLVAFNVINTRNRFVYLLGDFLYRVTEPALRPIRRVMPNLGGLDISPVLLILLLMFVQRLLVQDLARALL
ncbi:YggT family protein [Ferrovibrio sp.]|uniref:YggT family protein n=1 Tax=Ferrovibrio sp. TaxID=1917215 RepID=UPI001B4AC0C4|nr:YggT family protein [Ferrovibrio sp.]MBP7062802.1 YggT family protein [Ferrovibrio sp.]